MAVVKVNGRETQALQRELARLLAVFRGRVDEDCGWWLDAVAEFRSEEYVLSCFGVAAEPFANELLVVAVDVGRVLRMVQ